MKLDIDYVSDLHLGFYASKLDKIELIDKLVEEKIKPQVNSNILVIAGDIDEDIDRVCEFLYACSKYYSKVIFILGNHEYYIPNIKFIYTDKMAEEYNYNSMNKVYKLNEIFKDSNNIIFLDKTNSTKGIYNYNNFIIAGDTLWYKPNTIIDWIYNYPLQNDSRFILSELSKREKILKLHEDSINWYNNLPNNLDLIISHIPPIRNKNNNRGNNSCYYTLVEEYKSPVWIYGHDHKENDITINNTRFISNPWGYDTKDFKIKSLTLKK